MNSNFFWLGISRNRCGVECGASGAKMVILGRRKSRCSVEGILVEDSPFEQRMKGFARQPVDLFRQLILKRDITGHGVCLIPEGAYQSTFVVIPKMGGSDASGASLIQAKKVLLWEGAEPEMERVSSDFAGDREGSYVVLSDWNKVRPWCSIVEQHGGFIEEATVRASAYAGLASFQNWHKDNRVVLVVDIGAATSFFCVLDSGEIRFVREVPTAGDALTKALTTEMSTKHGTIHLTISEAEDIKTVPGVPLSQRRIRFIPNAAGETPVVDDPAARPETDYLDVMVRPVTERISSEVVRSIKFFSDNTGRKVDAVMVTGGSSELPGLIEQIAAAVPVPVEKLDPFRGMEFASAELERLAQRSASRLAVPAGLAVSESHKISLLSRTLRSLRHFAQYATRLAISLLLFGFLPLLAGVVIKMVKIQQERPELESAKRSLQVAKVDQERILSSQAELQRLTVQNEALKNIMGREMLWAGILNSVAAAVPKDIVLTRLVVRQDEPPAHSATLTIEGHALPGAGAFDTALASLLSGLGSSPFFTQVRSESAKFGVFLIRCEVPY